MELLRVEWLAITDALVASLVGPVDETSLGVVLELVSVATDVPRLLVDLERVEAIDERGIAALESLSALSNVGIVNVPTPVHLAMHELGRLGF